MTDSATPKNGAPIANSDPPQRPTDAPQVPFPPEILDKLPAEAKEKLSTFIAMTQMSGPIPNPLLSKLNEAHLSQIIEQLGDDQKYQHEDRKSHRRLVITLAILAAVFTLLLAAILAWLQHFEAFTPIITALFGFLGGLGLGRAWDRLST